MYLKRILLLLIIFSYSFFISSMEDPREDKPSKRLLGCCDKEQKFESLKKRKIEESDDGDKDKINHFESLPNELIFMLIETSCYEIIKDSDMYVFYVQIKVLLNTLKSLNQQFKAIIENIDNEAFLKKITKDAAYYFAPEYAGLNSEELNLELQKIIRENHPQSAARPHDNITPEISSAKSKIVKLIIAGADINSIDHNKDGYAITALNWAIRWPLAIDAVKFLISFKALDIPDENKDKALSTVMDFGFYSPAKMLMLAGYYGMDDINGIDEKDRTLFEILLCNDAIYKGNHVPNIELIEIAIKHGININSPLLLGKHNNKLTALMIASTQGWTDVINVLLKYNADVNIQDGAGKTALIKAISAISKTYSIQAMLSEDEMKKMWSGIESCKTDGDYCQKLKIIFLLLDAGTNINLICTNGENALMISAKFGLVGIVEELLKRGSDINAQNNLGQTALMIAHNEMDRIIDRLYQTFDFVLNPEDHHKNHPEEDMPSKADHANAVNFVYQLIGFVRAKYEQTMKLLCQNNINTELTSDLYDCLDLEGQ